MKRICMFLLLVVFSVQIFADDDEDKLRLAVMEFEDKSGKLSDTTLSNATEYIRGAFVSSNKFIVIAKERQENAMIKQMKKESYKLCNDKNCQIPLGQALSADTILRTTITFLGGTYTITSELIDLEKEATTKGAKATFAGDEKSLLSALDEIVAQLIDKQEENRPQNFQDVLSCEQAKKESKDFAWKAYLKTYPKGECAAEAKNELDKMACKTAEKKNSIEGWEEYLEDFPDGKCKNKAKAEFDKASCKVAKQKNSVEGWKEYLEKYPNGKCKSQAQTTSKKQEEKEKRRAVADEKVSGFFSGQWNLGTGIAFSTQNYIWIQIQTGLDFNFKVFEKHSGDGLGILFAGFGVDFKYWQEATGKKVEHYTQDDKNNNVLSIPIQLNLGYEFKIKNPTLRYVGLCFSPGLGFDMDIEGTDDESFFYQVSFSWDVVMNMIFNNGMLLNVGIGGNKSKEKELNHNFYWGLDHTSLTIGTGTIF